jgi:hypothetical protein
MMRREKDRAREKERRVQLTVDEEAKKLIVNQINIIISMR